MATYTKQRARRRRRALGITGKQHRKAVRKANKRAGGGFFKRW